jgi:putative tryptophan/tyrosine transport system substrate-binding protein
MRRREFISLLGGATAAWPLAARAQQPDRIRRIGVLAGLAEDDPEMTARLAGFRQGLEKRGWSDGRNVRIDYRYAPESSADRAQVLAKELIALQPDAIFAQATSVVAALQRETRTIPIVIVAIADPIGSGFIASLPRPGGNITGVMLYEASVSGKWLAMLKEIAPRLDRVALVTNPKTAPFYNYYLRAAESLSPSLGIKLVPSLVENSADLERTIGAFARTPTGGLLLPPDTGMNVHRDLIIALRGPAQFAGGLLVASVRRGRGSHVLRGRRSRHVPANSGLCRPHPARRQSRRPSGTGGDQVRNDRQPQNSEGTRLDRAARPARGRRRGNRMTIGRREFITLLGSTAAAWPLAARAQQPAGIRRMGVLYILGPEDPEVQARNAVFERNLLQLGWTIDRDLQIDWRYGGGDVESLRRYAAELAALAPDVILAVGSPTVAPLQQVTRTIPIVFSNVADPVGAGFVQSLARPGGNTTGFTNFEYSMSGKWVELLKQIAPAVKRVAVLRDPTVAAGLGQFGAIQSVAQSLGIEVTPMAVYDPAQVEREVMAFARSGNNGLIVTAGGMAAHRSLIVRLASSYKLPAVYPFRDYAVDGGLITYGPDTHDLIRRAASYVDRILKGEKPGDLPVQAPTKYELVINLMTAKALGLDIPAALLARSDEVIE